YAPAAVPHDRGMWVAARGKPAGGIAVGGGRLRARRERRAFGRAAVADREDVVPAAVERERREAELGEARRQEARRAAVEVHRVAVKQERRRARFCAGGLVPCALER